MGMPTLPSYIPVFLGNNPGRVMVVQLGNGNEATDSEQLLRFGCMQAGRTLKHVTWTSSEAGKFLICPFGQLP